MLVVTEGEKTERQYLEGLAKFARATGISFCSATVVGLGRDPYGVVQEAIRRKREDFSTNGKEDRFSAVWAVFDVDEHERIVRAVEVAKKEGINIAVSNPCFEIWLLWHFESFGSAVNPATLRRRLRTHGIEGKALPRLFPFAKFVEALNRAGESCKDLDPYAVPSNPGCSLLPLIVLVARRQAS